MKAIIVIFRIWDAISSPSRRCKECLEDIPKNAERCPHCRALQHKEKPRTRERDAGWL